MKKKSNIYQLKLLENEPIFEYHHDEHDKVIKVDSHQASVMWPPYMISPKM